MTIVVEIEKQARWRITVLPACFFVPGLGFDKIVSAIGKLELYQLYCHNSYAPEAMYGQNQLQTYKKTTLLGGFLLPYKM
ncbi:MAG: hypothetical protein RR461_03705 [Angelakisella sp.]